MLATPQHTAFKMATFVRALDAGTESSFRRNTYLLYQVGKNRPLVNVQSSTRAKRATKGLGDLPTAVTCARRGRRILKFRFVAALTPTRVDLPRSRLPPTGRVNRCQRASETSQHSPGSSEPALPRSVFWVRGIFRCRKSSFVYLSFL